jgi:shikimate dehydrogenase
VKSISAINTGTKLCAIIGNPVKHSMSPAIHNKAFEELGLNYVYLAFETSDVKEAVNAMRVLDNFVGMSVTIPHKVEVIKYIDETAEVDRKIGSINTVVKRDGKLLGLGTDGPGARQALIDKNININGADVVIAGSGGAARAIAFDLAFNTELSSLTLLGVVPDELENLTNDIKTKTKIMVKNYIISQKTIKESLEGASILIHATPVGMHPHVEKSIIPKEFLHENLSVMDIVYNPIKTKLIRDAQGAGLKTVSGVEMFVNQAVAQFETWTGHKAPKETMKKIVIKNLEG